jgi:hypothetical protein
MQSHSNQSTSSVKFKIFGLISIIVFAATVPITFQHVTHPGMIYHILVHVASLIIAVFLSFISVSAYFRDGRLRLMFMSFGFVTLAVLELLLLLAATGNIDQTIIPSINVELSHVLLLFMITLFGVGVLKVN